MSDNASLIAEARHWANISGTKAVAVILDRLAAKLEETVTQSDRWEVAAKMWQTNAEKAEGELAKATDLSAFDRRADELRALADNWDTYGGKKIEEAAIQAALAVAKNRPELVPCSHGGVELYWSEVANMEFLPDGTLDFDAKLKRELASAQERITEESENFRLAIQAGAVLEEQRDAARERIAANASFCLAIADILRMGSEVVHDLGIASRCDMVMRALDEAQERIALLERTGRFLPLASPDPMDEFLVDTVAQLTAAQERIAALESRERDAAIAFQCEKSRAATLEARITQAREAATELELNCPCGARPESLNTHPHVMGCCVARILAALNGPVPEKALTVGQTGANGGDFDCKTWVPGSGPGEAAPTVLEIRSAAVCPECAGVPVPFGGTARCSARQSNGQQKLKADGPAPEPQEIER